MAVFDEHQNVIMGASSAGGYTIDQSVRFERADTPYMTWTPGGAPTSRRAHTFSFWFKRSQLGVTVSSGHYLFGTSGLGFSIRLTSNDELHIITSSSNTCWVDEQKFRDVSAWYHLVVAIDTDQATAADRCRVYLNGAELTVIGTLPTLNSNQDFGHTVAQYLGYSAISQPFDGYMAEVIVVDGQQLTPSDFGEYNRDGVWIPKAYAGTYGTNGFYLDFADSGSLGTDVSGNGNDLTPSGITSDDQVTDSPTDNFCTLNRVHNATGASYLSDGNLHFDPNANWRRVPGTFLIPATGKWAFKVTSNNASSARVRIGVADASVVTPANWTTTGTSTLNISGCYVYADAGTFGENGDGGSAYGESYQSAADYVEVLVDSDSNTLTFTKNGSSQGTATSSLPNGVLVPLIEAYDNTLTCDFGQGGYTPSDSSYKPLSTANLPTPAIADGSAYFQTTLYTGTGAALEINQTGNSTFQPDFVWAKSRSGAQSHRLADAIRGSAVLFSDSTAAEDTTAGISFDTDGFSWTNSDGSNANDNTVTYAAWQWLAGNGTVSNSDGDITSTVSVNDDSGFSIVSWTLGSTDNQTVGHGLSAAPEFMFLKNRDAVGGWTTYHKDNTSAPETEYLRLDATNATTDSALPWNDTAPTSSVFTIGDASWFGSASDEMIMYCFRSIPGFSKFGGYTGNGSANGSFVYCGFRPALVIIKRTSGTATKWIMLDSARDLYNPTDAFLLPNQTDAETQGTDLDFLSNGFKGRANAGSFNEASTTYVFAAFAEHPFGGDGVAPVTAR